METLSKTALYCRKSTEDMKRQIYSIEDQYKINKELAERFNLEVIEIFKESKTAKKPGRPFFNEMTSKIQKGIYDNIVCWNADRLARNGVDAGIIVHLLAIGKLKRIITPSRIYTINDIQVLYIDFGYANQYIINLSQNVKRRFNEKVQNGESLAKAKYGYIKVNKLFIPDPNTFHFFQRGFKMLIYENYKPKQILEFLNKNYIKAFNGKPLYFQALSKIFHDKFYCGYITHAEKEYKGIHIPMITEFEFHKAQKVLKSLANNSKKRELKVNDKFLLNSCLKCSTCNHNLTGYYAKNRWGNLYGYYRCYNKDCKNKDNVKKEEIENVIKTFITHITFDTTGKEKLKHKIEEKLSLNIDMQKEKERLQGGLKLIESKEKRLDDLLEEGIYSIDKYRSKIKAINEEKLSILDSIENLDKRNERIDTIVHKGMDILDSLEEFYNSLDERYKKRILLAMFPDGITKDTISISLTAKKHNQSTIKSSIEIIGNLHNIKKELI